MLVGGLAVVLGVMYTRDEHHQALRALTAADTVVRVTSLAELGALMFLPVAVTGANNRLFAEDRLWQISVLLGIVHIVVAAAKIALYEHVLGRARGNLLANSKQIASTIPTLIKPGDAGTAVNELDHVTHGRQIEEASDEDSAGDHLLQGTDTDPALSGYGHGQILLRTLRFFAVSRIIWTMVVVLYSVAGVSSWGFVKSKEDDGGANLHWVLLIPVIHRGFMYVFGLLSVDPARFRRAPAWKRALYHPAVNVGVSRSFSKSRHVAFRDGVYAVIATILIIEFEFPKPTDNPSGSFFHAETTTDNLVGRDDSPSLTLTYAPKEYDLCASSYPQTFGALRTGCDGICIRRDRHILSGRAQHDASHSIARAARRPGRQETA